MTLNPIQVQKFLSGVDYPATKDDIVETARSQGADDDTLEALRNLPRDDFNSPTTSAKPSVSRTRNATGRGRDEANPTPTP